MKHMNKREAASIKDIVLYTRERKRGEKMESPEMISNLHFIPLMGAAADM